MNSCNTDIFFSNYYHLQSVCFELISVSLICIHSSDLSSTDDKNSGESFSTSNSGSMSAMMLVNFPAQKHKAPVS